MQPFDLAIPTGRVDWMRDLFVKADVISKAVPTALLTDSSLRNDAARLSGK